MKPKDVYQAWAPESGAWTPWVKPVLFAAMVQQEPEKLERLAMEAEGATSPDDDAVLANVGDFFREEPEPTYRSRARDAAIVIDLPGARAVQLGAALVERGVRPIPLYNALPAQVAIVDVWPILGALIHHAEDVRAAPIAAPPAFLLDADREGDGRGALRDALFDNRAVCRESDFPSADRLREAGVRRVLLITEFVRSDLLSIVLGWQAAGMALWWQRPGTAAARVTLRAPWLGRRLWTGLVRLARPSPRIDGAYGRMIVQPSAS